jgi:hypothetical protein
MGVERLRVHEGIRNQVTNSSGIAPGRFIRPEHKVLQLSRHGAMGSPPAGLTGWSARCFSYIGAPPTFAPVRVGRFVWQEAARWTLAVKPFAPAG